MPFSWGWTSVLAILGTVASCYAFPVPGLNVWELLGRSDTVWRGEILETVAEDTETARLGGRLVAVRWLKARIRVDRVLKGTADRVCEFQFPVSCEEFVPYEFVEAGAYVIVFLSRDHNRLVFATPFSGKLRVPRGDAESIVQAASPEEALHEELVRALGSDRRQEVLDALRQLALSPSPPRAEPIRDLTASPDRAIQGRAFATLFAIGDTSCFPACLGFLRAQPVDDAMDQGQRIAAIALSDLSQAQLDSIAQTYAQEAATDLTSALAPLLNHKTASVRTFVSRVFRKIANRAILPALVNLLDNPDRDVQYNIILALYQAAEGPRNTRVKGLVPSREEFLQDPMRYATQWKQWWQDGGKIERPKDEHGNEIPSGPVSIGPPPEQ